MNDLYRDPEAGVESSRPDFTLMGQLRATIFRSWINILFLMIPVGIALNFTHINPVATFITNFVAIIPLAAMLSDATEQITYHIGDTLGGLLNATFGNAVELIVSIIALTQGQVDIVQESLIGSMLSNLLLVMGMCFIGGGINRVEQQFNVTVAQTSSSLQIMAAATLSIPVGFQAWARSNTGQTSAEIAENVTRVSRGIAVVFLFTYAACLFFQLKTHASMYNTPGPKTKRRSQNEDVVNTNAVGSTEERSPVVQAMDALTQNSEEPSEQAQVRLWVAILTLVVSTIFVGICADFMTRAINDMSPRNGTGKLSRTFVGLILVPIVGNAAEHATAVTMAIKDKMDLAIGVAIGSSTQIALGVIPFVVVVGWILGNEDMNLAFDGFQIALLIAAVFLISSLIQDGKSNWLEGVIPMTLYIGIAIAAWYYPSSRSSEG